MAPADHQTQLRDLVCLVFPQVQGHPVHSNQGGRCPNLVCGNPSPAGEGCNRAGPSNRHEVRVCQPLLYCGKEERLVTTNLESASFDPCASQAAVQDVDAVAHFECICPLDWFAVIDLKDARFRVSILPCQGIPAIRDRGSGMSVQAPAFRAPRLDGFSGHLGKEQTRANAEDLFSRHGFRFGQPDFMPHPGTCSVSAELPRDFIRQDGGPTETLLEAPGGYGCSRGDSSAWLLHVRLPQHWLYGRVPRWSWKRGTHRVQISPACRRTFSLRTDPLILRAGVPLEQVSRHAVLLTDASATDLGATYNGNAVSGVWMGPQLRCHTNCLEFIAVFLALGQLRVRLRGKDVLVRMDNTATFAYINRQCGLRSRRMSQLACHLLIWSQKHRRFVPSTSQECSIRWPTSCFERHFLGSGDSIPRQSS